jgi:hypothetical protein
MRSSFGIASYDTPTWIRRRWKGRKTSDLIVDAFSSFLSRATSGELIWR